jgi:hypothetical protein
LTTDWAGDLHRVGVEQVEELVHRGGADLAADRGGGPLADAVPGDRVGSYLHPGQRRVEQLAHLDQAGAVPAQVGGGPLAVRQTEVGGQVGGPGGELRLQAGEDEGELARPRAEQRLRAEPDVPPAPPRLPPGDRLAGHREQLVRRVDDAQPGLRRSVPA